VTENTHQGPRRVYKGSIKIETEYFTGHGFLFKFMLLWTLCLIQSKKSTYLAVKQLYERGLSSDIHPRSLREYNFSNTRSLWILIYREE